MKDPADKERYLLIGLFISIAASIFGAGVLYQKAENNAANIQLIVQKNTSFSNRDDDFKNDVRYLAERISSLEAKIEALDDWCRKNLKKK